jgi:SAM-dependent methyltransferase
MSAGDQDYILGTGDVELERLGLQHRVWRPYALDAWRRAGFTIGHTLVDVGCGPGYAALDLAGIVGPGGRVIAVDRSRRFLDALEAECRRHGLRNVRTIELDLADAALPELAADGAWCRWVLCFVPRPRETLVAVARSLRSGGVLVVHEYFDYGTWRLAPRCPELEEFVALVMATWRAAGGEPDIALEIPGWLEESGLQIQSLKPIVDVVLPGSFTWQWPATFLRSGLARLVELSQLSAERAAAIAEAFAIAERRAGTRMVTPGVLEIIAKRA